jgi:hypothetical protein
VTRGRVEDVGVATAAFRWRQDGVVCETVCTAAAKHEGINAHSHVASLRLDAFPNKHASAVQAVHRTWFGTDLVACNIRSKAEFRIVFVIGGGKYTCTQVRCTVSRYISVREVLQVRTVLGIQDNCKDIPLVASGLSGTQQIGIWKLVSSVDLENFASRHRLFGRFVKWKIKNFDLCHFSRKGTYNMLRTYAMYLQGPESEDCPPCIVFLSRSRFVPSGTAGISPKKQSLPNTLFRTVLSLDTVAHNSLCS